MTSDDKRAAAAVLRRVAKREAQRADEDGREWARQLLTVAWTLEDEAQAEDAELEARAQWAERMAAVAQAFAARAPRATGEPF